MEAEHPHLRSTMLAALGNVVPSHLLDRELAAADSRRATAAAARPQRRRRAAGGPGPASRRLGRAASRCGRPRLRRCRGRGRRPARTCPRRLALRGGLGQRPGQRQGQDLVHRAHRLDLDPAAHVLGDLRQLGHVAGRDDRQAHARARRRQQLLLQPADRQHPPAQGELAGHGHVAADGDARGQRDQHAGDGDARRGPVLGNAARRDVDVDLPVAGRRRCAGPATAPGPGRTTAPPAPTPSSRRRAGRSAPAGPARP